MDLCAAKYAASTNTPNDQNRGTSKDPFAVFWELAVVATTNACAVAHVGAGAYTNDDVYALWVVGGYNKATNVVCIKIVGRYRIGDEQKGFGVKSCAVLVFLV